MIEKSLNSIIPTTYHLQPLCGILILSHHECPTLVSGPTFSQYETRGYAAALAFKNVPLSRLKDMRFINVQKSSTMFMRKLNKETSLASVYL